MWFEKKKCQFPIYPSYRFCPIPKIENSEISESFLLLKFLVLYETQNLKTDWKMTPKKKTLAFSCRLRREKCQFPRFPSFRFCPIPKIENSEISESVLLLQILTVFVTFSKFVFSASRVKTCFFCDLILSDIFPKNFNKVPHVVPKTWNFLV